jgi:hypothetical protein
MRTVLPFTVVLCAGLWLTSGPNLAQDKQEKVVLKGMIACARCELQIEKKCASVIVVKDAKSKQDVIYFFDKVSNAKYHGDVCTETRKGTVEGTISDDGKRKIVTVQKLTYEE